jgi:hypothetical protein
MIFRHRLVRASQLILINDSSKEAPPNKQSLWTLPRSTAYQPRSLRDQMHQFPEFDSEFYAFISIQVHERAVFSVCRQPRFSSQTGLGPAATYWNRPFDREPEVPLGYFKATRSFVFVFLGCGCGDFLHVGSRQTSEKASLGHLSKQHCLFVANNPTGIQLCFLIHRSRHPLHNLKNNSFSVPIDDDPTQLTGKRSADVPEQIYIMLIRQSLYPVSGPS